MASTSGASGAAALRREVSVKLKAEIERRGLSKTAAARALGISKQRLHHYLRAAVTPRTDFVATLLREWGLVLELEGEQFGVGAFTTRKGREPKSTRSTQLPLPLFEQARVLDGGAVVIRFSRAGLNRTELELTIKHVAEEPQAAPVRRVKRA